MKAGVLKVGALALALLSAGCGTMVLGPDGRPELVTRANVQRLHFKSPDRELTMEGVDHSTPTTKAMNGMGNIITTTGAAFGAGAVGL